MTRITDVKGTGYYHVSDLCPECNKEAGEFPLRVTLCTDNKTEKVYMHRDCYPQLRAKCQVDISVSMFGS